MPGKFLGLSNCQWELLNSLLPSEPEVRWKGQPPAPFRPILNTIFYVLITGCRWCDVPVGPKWGKRTTSHRWLGTWLSDGTLKKMKARLLGAAHLAGKIDWSNGSIDGSFAAGKGGGEGVDYGFKGKGVLTHALVDGNGLPLAVTSTGASGNEREQVEPLLDGVALETGKKGRQKKRPRSLELDKGYDARDLRKKNPESRNSSKDSPTKMEKRKTAQGAQVGKAGKSLEG